MNVFGKIHNSREYATCNMNSTKCLLDSLYITIVFGIQGLFIASCGQCIDRSRLLFRFNVVSTYSKQTTTTSSLMFIVLRKNRDVCSQAITFYSLVTSRSLAPTWEIAVSPVIME